MEPCYRSYERWIVLVFIIACVRSSQGMHDQVLSIENCDVTSVIGGHPITIQELCGENFAVMVTGISNDRERFPSDSFPWILEMTLTTDEQNPENVTKSSKFVTIEEAQLTGDDVTYILLEHLQNYPVFEIPAGKCDNRDGRGTMHLYSNHSINGSMNYLSSGFFRVLCDFSGTDLVLETSEELANMSTTEVIIDGNTSLSEALGLYEMEGFQVTLSGHVPMLEPEDACIFAIAYLTKDPFADGMERMTFPDHCSNHSIIPRITYRDTLVGTPICYRYDSGSVDLLDIVRSSVDPIRLCGPHVLVLQVDPMDTLHNEGNKCNKYVTFDVNFNCDQFMMGPVGPGGPSESYARKSPSHCEMHMGPFGSGLHELFDTRFTHHSIRYDDMNSEYYNRVVMFRQNGKRWIESRDDHAGVQAEGFGLLKVFNRFLESVDMTGMCDDLATDVDVQSAISELEGVNEAYDEVYLSEWIPEYMEARTTLEQMKTSTNVDYEGIATTMMSKLHSVVKPADDRPYYEKMRFRMAESAYNATAMIASTMSSGKGHNWSKMHAADDACMVSGSVEYLPHLLSMLDQDMGYNQNHVMMEITDIVGNFTRVALSMRHFYPQFTCLEQNLKRLMGYLKRWENASYDEKQTMDTDWLYDSEQVRDVNRKGEGRIQFTGCAAKPNHCMKKVRTICHAVEPARHVTSSEEVRDGVCKARLMKQKAKEQYRILGLQKHKEMMVVEGMHDYCRNDPIAPQTGPLTLWKMADELFGQGHAQIVYRGTPTLDNREIMWRKVAVCSCDVCTHDTNRNFTMYQGP